MPTKTSINARLNLMPSSSGSSLVEQPAEALRPPPGSPAQDDQHGAGDEGEGGQREQSEAQSVLDEQGDDGHRQQRQEIGEQRGNQDVLTERRGDPPRGAQCGDDQPHRSGGQDERQEHAQTGHLRCHERQRERAGEHRKTDDERPRAVALEDPEVDLEAGQEQEEQETQPGQRGKELVGSDQAEYRAGKDAEQDLQHHRRKPEAPGNEGQQERGQPDDDERRGARVDHPSSRSGTTTTDSRVPATMWPVMPGRSRP